MLRSILAEDIRDNRFLRLIDRLSRPGIWRNGATMQR